MRIEAFRFVCFKAINTHQTCLFFTQLPVLVIWEMTMIPTSPMRVKIMYCYSKRVIGYCLVAKMDIHTLPKRLRWNQHSFWARLKILLDKNADGVPHKRRLIQKVCLLINLSFPNIYSNNNLNSSRHLECFGLAHGMAAGKNLSTLVRLATKRYEFVQRPK